MRSDRLGQKVFFALAGLFLLFIVYTSWTIPIEEAVTQRGFFTGIKRLPNVFWPRVLRDWLSNIVLYAPLGMCIGAAVSGERPRFFTRWLVIGLLVSAVMEFGQQVVGRVPDALDLITNTIGYVIGYWAVVGVVRWYHVDPAVLIGFGGREAVDLRTQVLAVTRFGYVCVYFLVALLPFDLSVNFSKVYYQLLPNDLGQIRIVLDPLHNFQSGEAGARLIFELLGLLPIAVLSSLLNGFRGRVDVALAIFPCVVVGVACEMAQLFIQSRTTDVIMIPLAFVAGVLGWALVRAWFRSSGAGRMTDDKPGKRWRGPAVAMIGYMFVVLWGAVAFCPIEPDHNMAASQLSGAVLFTGGTTVVDLLQQLIIFIPLGVVISLLLGALGPSAGVLKLTAMSGMIGGAFAVFAEVVQFPCVAHRLDVTAALLGLVGTVVGALLIRWLRPIASGVAAP